MCLLQLTRLKLWLCLKLTNCLIKNALNPNRWDTHLTHAEREAVKSLQNNDCVTIMKADKGGGRVILNKTDYDKKLYDN